MIFGDGVGASLVRGPHCQLDVGLCEVDVFLYWNSAAEEGAWVGLKPDLQGGTGFNLLRVQFWTPVQKKRVSKRVRKWTRLKSKVVPPGGLFFSFVAADIALRLGPNIVVPPGGRLESWTGEAHFCAPAFSYVLRSKKGPLLCHIVLLQFPWPWGPRGLPRSLPWRVVFFFPWSRDTGVQDLHWGLPPTLFHPIFFLVWQHRHRPRKVQRLLGLQQ